MIQTQNNVYEINEFMMNAFVCKLNFKTLCVAAYFELLT